MVTSKVVPKPVENGDPLDHSHRRNLELQKVEIERQKLNIELQKLNIEKSKTRWTAFAAIVPLLAIAVTVGYGFWTMQAQSRLTFQLEVAKAVMQAPDPDQALNRADFYRKMFPDEVADRFFNFNVPRTYGDGESSADTKINFLRLVAGRGLDPAHTVAMWHLIFPGDKWANEKDLLDFVEKLPAQASKATAE